MTNFLDPTSPAFIIMLTLMIWSLPWKAISLWKAARRKDLVWFIVLFLVNTLGVLDILYIFIFSKDKQEN
jgi:hypothetical protein